MYTKKSTEEQKTVLLIGEVHQDEPDAREMQETMRVLLSYPYDPMNLYSVTL